MRIEKRKRDAGGKSRVVEKINRFLENSAAGAPPCAPNCKKADPARCSRHCPDIPRMLSSDPENFPLEGKIAPLVYELARLDAFHPCWSCEGHLGPDGKLWKIPRVWFFCASVELLRALSEGVRDLDLNGHLSVPWQIVVTYSDNDNSDTTFALEPVISQESPALGSLQRDIGLIAEHLREVVRTQARHILKTAI